MLRLLALMLAWGIASPLAADCLPPYYGYRFLTPEVLPYQSRLGPYFRAFGATYGTPNRRQADLRRTVNVREWYERYCEQVELAELEALIYGNTLGRLRDVLALISNKEATGQDLPSTLRGNSFARHLVDYRCTEVVTYLIFAKRVEPYVTRRGGNPFRQVDKDRLAMEALINEGLDAFPTLASHYVRLRYAYQLIRLAHYLGEFAYALELYDYLMPKVEANPSVLYDWIEGHRAGALQATGDYATSAYLYSRIFDRCPSCRESAFTSFRVQTDAQWRAASNLANNDHERAMLHVLRAQTARAVVIEELDDIYVLDPTNTALEPLVMRELLALERDFLGEDFNPEADRNRRRGLPRPGATERLVALQAFINRVVDDGRAANPRLWLLAQAAVEMLGGDYFYARRTLGRLARLAPEDTLADQMRILREVTNVLALNRITDSVELYYYDLLANEALRARYPDLRPLVNDKMEAVYRANGRFGKAALLQYGFDAIQKNPTLSYVKELEGMADSLLGNRFDRALLADRVGPNPVDDINDLLGTYYLQRGQWETALGVFRRVPAAERDAYGTYVPFVQQLNDRVSFRPPVDAPRYNKVGLLERLLELEDEARRTTNDTLAARNFFNIGLAHYNMSYYGYNWRMADYFRSGASGARAARQPSRDFVFPHPAAPLGNKENMNMDRAAYYFERALERAPTREAAARAAFFAAKTQRNMHYAAGTPGPRPFTYFALLRDVYADTRFYQEAVRECRTFAWFVGL